MYAGLLPRTLITGGTMSDGSPAMTEPPVVASPPVCASAVAFVAASAAVPGYGAAGCSSTTGTYPGIVSDFSSRNLPTKPVYTVATVLLESPCARSISCVAFRRSNSLSRTCANSLVAYVPKSFPTIASFATFSSCSLLTSCHTPSTRSMVCRL